MRRTLLLILFVPLLAAAQAPRQGDVWQPFKYFLGTWSGTGKGESGISQLEREYKFVLGEKFLSVTHKSVYKPQEKNPKGETHEDWGFFSYDRRRKLHVFRQFHVEGFVTQYVSETTAPDGKTLVFTAESLENLPASWRARETYRILNNDEFIEVFELAAPGKEFSVYSENHFKRQKSAGVVLPISPGALPREREYTAFGSPERITIRNYSGHAMEPFITRDGRYLFFNNSNDPSVDTNLHYAKRINDVTFKYKGEIKGVNTEALDAVPTMDRDGNLYFVSTRSYKDTLSTIYRGRFSHGIVKGVDLVANISEKRPGRVNFDVEISPGGDALYFADGIFSGKPVPEKADIAIAVRDGSGFRRWQKSTGLLKNINTDALEYAACISSNELELFFTRLGDKGLAIYRSTRKTVAQPFDLPERLVAIEGFVEAPTLAADGRSLYYHKKDGELFAIYRVTRRQE